MKKAIYRNPKSGKLYTFKGDREKGEEVTIHTVFDNAKTYENSSDIKEDKNGRAYKICECEEKITKNGYVVFVTVEESWYESDHSTKGDRVS